MSTNTPSAEERVDLESRLNRMLGLVRRFDALEHEMVSTKQQYRRLAPGVPHTPSAKPVGRWVCFLLALPLCVVTWPVVMIAISMVMRFTPLGDVELNFGGRTLLQLVAYSVTYGLALLVSLPIHRLWNTAGLRRRNAALERTNQQIDQRNAQVAEANRSVEVFNAGVHNAVLRVDDERTEVAIGLRELVADRYPMTYLYDEAVGFCLQMVRDHRASTVSEALNLYETELHRRRMENLAQAQVAEQQRATRMAMLGNVINAAGHAATAATVRAQGEATRHAAQGAAAATQRTIRDESQAVRDRLARPVKIR